MSKKNHNEHKSMDLILEYIDEYQLNTLSKEDQYKLFKDMEQGSIEAREQLILHNLCLVISIAKKFKDKVYDISELFNVGCQGLIIAIERFDYKKGYCFSTYAKYWIKGYINRYLVKNYFNFKVPIAFITEILKVKKYILTYYSQYGIQPTNTEIATELHVSKDEVLEYKALLDNTLSLNKILYNEEQKEEFFSEYKLIEKIPEEDNCILEFENTYLNELLKNSVFNSCNLTKRQKEVLWYYFGFETGEPMDCSEVAPLLSITKQRVYELKQRAIEKLQNSEIIEQFNPKLMIK